MNGFSLYQISASPLSDQISRSEELILVLIKFGRLKERLSLGSSKSQSWDGDLFEFRSFILGSDPRKLWLHVQRWERENKVACKEYCQASTAVGGLELNSMEKFWETIKEVSRCYFSQGAGRLCDVSAPTWKSRFRAAQRYSFFLQALPAWPTLGCSAFSASEKALRLRHVVDVYWTSPCRAHWSVKSEANGWSSNRLCYSSEEGTLFY